MAGRAGKYGDGQQQCGKRCDRRSNTAGGVSLISAALAHAEISVRGCEGSQSLVGGVRQACQVCAGLASEASHDVGISAQKSPEGRVRETDIRSSRPERSSPARIRTEVLSIMSRRLWAAELRGRALLGVVPHCFRRYLSVRSCQSHRHLQTRCAACFGRSLCSSSYPEIPCLWRLCGEVSGEVHRCCDHDAAASRRTV